MNDELVFDIVIDHLKNAVQDYAIDKYSQDYIVTNPNGAILIHRGRKRIVQVNPNVQRGTPQDNENLMLTEWKIIILSRVLYNDKGLYNICTAVETALTEFYVNQPFRFYYDGENEPLYDEDERLYHVEMLFVLPSYHFIGD